jgi:hypothetical protein
VGVRDPRAANTSPATIKYGRNEYGGLPVNSPYCAAAQFFSSEAMVQRSEIENDAQRRINAAHLVEA